MTQIENEIYTELRAILIAAFPGIFVTGEYTPTPDKFPCVFIEEADNYTVSLDGSNKGEVSAVMYEINAFSNLQNGRKSEVKKIIKTIDDFMTLRGFMRRSCMPTPNMDTTVYRMTARYEASVYNETIYRR